MKKMVGLGTWRVKVNSLFFKGDVTVKIKDNNGEYDFEFNLPEKFKNVRFKYYDIHTSGNTIIGKGELALFPGKVMEGAFTFEGDKMNGSVRLPFLGNKEIKIKDGQKIG